MYLDTSLAVLVISQKVFQIIDIYKIEVLMFFQELLM